MDLGVRTLEKVLQQCARHPSAEPGHQAGKADCVGKKTRREQKYATGEQDQAFDEFNGGYFAVLGGPLHPGKRLEALPAQQPGPEYGSQDHNENCGPGADQPTYRDQ